MRMLCVGGGTLGSVSPVLAMVEAMGKKQPDFTAVFVGSRQGPEKAILEQSGMEFFGITAGKFRRYFSMRTLLTPFEILIGFFESLVLLAKIRPHIVVSAGSFVAVPVVWAAVLYRIPVYIHQQDIRPGLANRLTAPFARRISVAFSESLAQYPASKTRHIGNPVRTTVVSGSAERARAQFQLRETMPTILILGGSTGAEGLNILVASVIRNLAAAVQWIHITGPRRSEPDGTPSATYHTVPFLVPTEIADAYAAADIVICRAGLATISELAALRKTAIVVPLPGTHQEENAAYLGRRHAAVVVHEREGAGRLAAALRRLLGDPVEQKELSNALHHINPTDAADRAVEIIDACVHG